MTFEEYQLELESHHYMVEYSPDLHLITVYNANHIQLLVFDSMANNECILDISARLNEIAYVIKYTNEFLSTPYEKRKLEPIYELLIDDNSYGKWLLGYDHEAWEIGKADDLEGLGYQTTFTDSELASIVTSPELASRIEVLKKRINYK